MAAFEIIDGDIVIKSFQETRDEIRSEWERKFPGIDLSPTSVDGHQVDLDALVVTKCNEGLQAVVANLDRRQAEGSMLEILAAFMSLGRLQATYSRPTIVFVGTPSTVIPLGATVTFEGCPYNFHLEAPVSIGNDGYASGICRCEVEGYVDLYVGDWVFVDNTPTGVTCRCDSKAGAGRDVETDEQLRQRMDEADSQGLATPDTMLTYLRDHVSSTVNLEINDEDHTVGGIPAHSFRVSIPDGAGTPDEIAQAIWDCKPAGIKSFGNNSGVAVSKVTGRSFVQYFSIPVPVNVSVKVSITSYEEETFPSDGIEQIKAYVEEWAKNEFIPGKDVIAIRFVVPVSKVPGILGIDVEVKREGGDWNKVRVPIDSEEYAVVKRDSVEVVKV